MKVLPEECLMRWMKPLAALTVFAFVVVTGCAPKPEETMFRGVSLRPPGAEELNGAVPQNSIYLFENRNFGGKVTRIENVTSLKWDLPSGVVVVFYENGDGSGNQFPIWGRGQLESVSKWAFNDKVSRWARYPVGDSANSSASVAQGRMAPHNARPTTNVPADTIEIYSDRDLKGRLMTVSPVSRESQTEYHSAGAVNDQMTS